MVTFSGSDPKTPLSGPPLGPPHPSQFTASPMIRDETFREKFNRKTRENPFVPIGCAATAVVLALGLRSLHRGDTRQSQMMMRGRIAAQGFTIAALIFGVMATALRPKE